MEYEVDEMGGAISKFALWPNRKESTRHFVHDKCIVDPGAIVSAENKPYVVRIGPPAHKNLKSSLCFPRSIRHIKEDGW